MAHGNSRPKEQKLNVAPGVRFSPVAGTRNKPTQDKQLNRSLKLAPTYPRGLLSRGIEGYVVVSFTINKTGAVENAMVVESTNKAFESASLRAVAKYKYKPRVIDGQAVEVHDVIEKISFEMENQ